MSASVDFERADPLTVDVRMLALLPAILFLSLVAAARWLPKTPDIENYRSAYDTLSSAHTFVGRFEPGYMVSMWICKFVYRIDFSSFLFVFTAISLSLKFVAFARLTRSAVLAAVVYTLILFNAAEYTAMRGGMAIGFAYLAISDVSRGQNWRAVALFVCAATFHYSSVVVAAATLFFACTWQRPYLSAVSVALIFGVLFVEWSAIASFLVANLGAQVSRELNAVSNEVIWDTLFTRPRLAFLLSVASIPLFGIPWRTESDALLFFLGISGSVVAIALRGHVTIASRLLELFEMAPVLLALRAPVDSARIVPAMAFAATGCLFSLPSWLQLFALY